MIDSVSDVELQPEPALFAWSRSELLFNAGSGSIYKWNFLIPSCTNPNILYKLWILLKNLVLKQNRSRPSGFKGFKALVHKKKEYFKSCYENMRKYRIIKIFWIKQKDLVVLTDSTDLWTWQQRTSIYKMYKDLKILPMRLWSVVTGAGCGIFDHVMVEEGIPRVRSAVTFRGNLVQYKPY
jgi:hypothetical protein